MLFFQSSSESQPHAEHVWVAALEEIVPGRYVFEGSHGKAFRASESHEGKAMFGSWSEALSTSHKMNDDALLDGEALGFVDGEGVACYEWELSPRHSGAVFVRSKREDGNPLWLILVESRSAVIWKLTYESIWTRANSTWTIHGADKDAARAICKTKFV